MVVGDGFFAEPLVAEPVLIDIKAICGNVREGNRFGRQFAIGHTFVTSPVELTSIGRQFLTTEARRHREYGLNMKAASYPE
jgi:hypothetical protein